MSKELEAWRYTRENYLQLKKEKYHTLKKEDLEAVLNSCNKRCDIIEKALEEKEEQDKALEIIKKKNVKIDVLKYQSDVVFYNMAVFEKEEKLTQEEFNLLKKELNNEI